MQAMVGFTGTRALDVGSGTGKSTFEIVKYANHVVGVEPWVEMRTFAVKIQERQGIRNVAFVDGTGENLPPFEKHTFAPYVVDIEVKGNKLSVTRTSPTICLGLVMAKQLQLPLETVCHTISQPFFRGIAKAINPSAMYSAVQMSEPECIETIELPELTSLG
jgi:SAM-dependent methyltransferase